jgi:hypothetical protein
VADASLADPAVMDFPSLAARSTSMISNMSGVLPVPPAAAPGRHRRSGSLTRCSLPPVSALSMSSSGHDGLSRVSVSTSSGQWHMPAQDPSKGPGFMVGAAGLARQGSGLFRTISGQR